MTWCRLSWPFLCSLVGCRGICAAVLLSGSKFPSECLQPCASGLEFVLHTVGQLAMWPTRTRPGNNIPTFAPPALYHQPSLQLPCMACPPACIRPTSCSTPANLVMPVWPRRASWPPGTLPPPSMLPLQAPQPFESPRSGAAAEALARMHKQRSLHRRRHRCRHVRCRCRAYCVHHRLRSHRARAEACRARLARCSSREHALTRDRPDMGREAGADVATERPFESRLAGSEPSGSRAAADARVTRTVAPTRASAARSRGRDSSLAGGKGMKGGGMGVGARTKGRRACLKWSGVAGAALDWDWPPEADGRWCRALDHTTNHGRRTDSHNQTQA
eukprot:364168-Chlamydomonas_euryale.AAC.7